jgi:hypothetical protein
MARLVLLALVAAVSARSLALGGVTLAASGDPHASQQSPPIRPVMAQKQLVSGTNCQNAAHAPPKPDFLSTSAEYRDDVLITTRYCSASAHNQLTPTAPEIVFVSADPNASGDVKIFFKTIPKNDPKKVHNACELAGKATSAYLQASTTAPTPQADGVIAGADVLTSSGNVDCDGFVRATQADNPLVVLAPHVISGSAISVHILNMIGLNQPATEVQVAVDNLGRQVAGSVALSGDEIRTHPQLVLGPPASNLR